jgi:hypothetical protein
VASVQFEFTAALRGKGGRSLDLVLIVDTTTGAFGDRDAGQVRRRIEALSRALDITQSRYVLTVILAGAALQSEIELLSETCRVLTVEDAALDDDAEPVDENALEALDDGIRVLLPLTLPSTPGTEGAHEGGALGRLRSALPSGVAPALLEAVLVASLLGEEAVTTAAAEAINHALVLEIAP